MKYVRKKRNKYSRNGCQECKRRKIKCNEEKPICFNCRRSKKVCVYVPPLPRRKPRKQFKNVSTVSNSSHMALDNSPTRTRSGIYTSFPSFSIGNVDSNRSVNSLAHGLNEIINSQIDQAEDNSLENIFENPDDLDPDQPVSDFLDVLQKGDYYKITPQKGDSQTASGPLPSFMASPPSIDSFEVCENHRKYLLSFCDDFSRVITPITPTPHEIPVRDIILTYAKDSNYLLAVVLSCGALQLHRRTHSDKDKSAYCSYLWICIKLLAQALSDQAKTRNQIEPMIMTLLLLASYTAVSNIQKWRPHLNVAKELLAAYAPRANSEKYKESCYLLAFCRAWFSSIDVIAGLTTIIGGTINNETEIDSLTFDLPNTKYYLEAMHLSRRDDFNLFYGFTNSLAVTLQRLAHYMRRMKNGHLLNSNSSPIIDIEEIRDLLHSIWENQNFVIISKDGVVPEDHFLNPTNKLESPPGFEPLSSEAIQKIEFPDGKSIYISWYDICQQSMAWTALLLVFTRLQGLPPTHFMVQEVVHKILSLMIFLSAKNRVIVYVMMLLQCPMYITGLNCVTEKDRNLTLRFFDSMNLMGNIAAKVNRAKLKHIWQQYDYNGKTITEFNEDIPKDIVSY